LAAIKARFDWAVNRDEMAKPTILIVEDEPIIRMGIADYIQRQGFNIIEAGTGDRAIDIIKTGTTIDVIVSDVQMPGTHDGIALALWTRRNFPHIKLILVSGATSGAVEELRGEGIILPKPYQYEAIVARIGELLWSADHAPSKQMAAESPSPSSFQRYP
jgi:DNA-binding response OmpR family regulator